tara:strand:+ start:8581 stop:8958 length:378 start_codon:yes stop_codon:yes gene_type:complete
MANFPSIVPNQRSLTLGDFPGTRYEGSSGVGASFLFSTADRVNQLLSLQFRAITEAQKKLIADHFINQQSGLLPFDLPNEIWSGYTTVPVSSSEYQWRYSESLEIEPGGIAGRFNVGVRLVAVPI